MKFRILLLSAAAVGSFGCGPAKDARPPKDAAATESGGRHEPQTEEERQLLAHVATLPSGVREKVGKLTLTASDKYQAASGFHCRRLFVDDAGKQDVKLACGDKKGWFFVPDVFRGESEQVDAEGEVQLSANGEATATEVVGSRAVDETNSSKKTEALPEETP